MSELDYCFKNTKMLECIKNKNFHDLHEMKREQFAKIISLYKRGMCTEHELQVEMDAWLYEGWFKLFRYLGISGNSLGYEDLVEFIHQYEEWIKNRNMGEERAWKSPSGLMPHDIFEILYALYIAPCFLKRISPNIKNPEEVIVQYMGGVADDTLHRLSFEYVDDGGLFEDANPEGKTFSIKRTDGVVANLQVVEKSDEYICIGTIDDYYMWNTTPPKPNIFIQVDNDKKITDFKVLEIYKDGEVTWHTNFPRWEEYHKAVGLLQQEKDDYLNRLRDCFMARE